MPKQKVRKCTHCGKKIEGIALTLKNPPEWWDREFLYCCDECLQSDQKLLAVVEDVRKIVLSEKQSPESAARLALLVAPYVEPESLKRRRRAASEKRRRGNEAMNRLRGKGKRSTTRRASQFIAATGKPKGGGGAKAGGKGGG